MEKGKSGSEKEPAPKDAEDHKIYSDLLEQLAVAEKQREDAEGRTLELEKENKELAFHNQQKFSLSLSLIFDFSKLNH